METTAITQTHRTQIEQDGYTVIRQMFALEEVEMYREHYMALRVTAGYRATSPASTPTRPTRSSATPA